MGSLAAEFKQKQNKDRTLTREAAAAKSLWEYEKLMNPKFFKEDRWHLKEIAETLQALVEMRIIRKTRGEAWHIASPEEISALDKEHAAYQVCRKLKLNIPPRHGKSYSLQMFEQWYLGVDNDNTVITVSYNETLSSRFSSNVRDGIDATKVDKRIAIFSDVFPNTRIKYGDAAKGIWALEGRFFSYLGTSFGGTLTGVGCRLGVIDDPVKSDKEAFNDSVLEDQWEWYTNTYLSRVEEGGFQIINMTRWSTKDLCGRLEQEEEADEWYTLCYPACLDADKIYKAIECRSSRGVQHCSSCTEFPCSRIKGMEQDENGDPVGRMMCPELLSFKSWDSKRRLTSRAIFEANYQQKPVDVTGALYIQGFKEYDPAAYDADLAEKKWNYTDTADTGSDSLCSICFDVIDGYAYVKDIYFTEEPMEVTEPETARRLKANDVRDALIESNNGGRGFGRNVERILKGWGWKRTNVNTFTQTKNKRARILSHATNVCELIIMPQGWEKKWPQFHKAVTTYQRTAKAGDHDDGPDVLTGITEMLLGEVKVRKKVGTTMSKSRLGVR